MKIPKTKRNHYPTNWKEKSWKWNLRVRQMKMEPTMVATLISSSCLFLVIKTVQDEFKQSHSMYFTFLGYSLIFISFIFVSLLTESQFGPQQILFRCLLSSSLSYLVLFQLSRLCFLCFTNYKGFLFYLWWLRGWLFFHSFLVPLEHKFMLIIGDF